MALPVTISSVSVGPRNSFHGPFISSNGDVFTILEDTTNDDELKALRNTDPGNNNFSESDSGNRPNMSETAGAALSSINVFQDSDKIHVLTQDVLDDVYYARFDMAAASNVGAWDDVTGTAGDKDQAVVTDPNSIDACDLVVRSSTVLAVFQDATESDMGTPYERVGFATKADKTTGAWTDRGYIGTNGMTATHVTGPRAVYAPTGARTHVVFREDGGTSYIAHTSMNSSNTATNNGDISEAPTVLDSINYPLGHGVVFTRSSTEKVRFPYKDDGGDLSIVEFDEAASPTYTFEDGVDGTNNVAHEVVGSVDVCLAVDGSRVHSLHVRNADDDLYSADDGDSDTWTTPTSTFTGTVNHISCNIYTRGGDTVLAHIIDDGGTVKYDEDVLSAAAKSVAASLNAAVEDEFVGSAALGAGVEVVGQTLTTGADAGVAGRNTRGTGLDTAVATSVTADASANAALETTLSTSATLDAGVERQNQTATADLDARLAGGGAKTADLGAALSKQFELTGALAGALQRRGQSQAASTNAALMVLLARSTEMDVAVERALVELAAFEAAVQGSLVRQTDFDSALANTNARTLAVDAALAGLGQANNDLDGALRAVLSGATSIDGAVRSSASLAASLEAAVRVALELTTALDAMLVAEGGQTRTVSFDAAPSALMAAQAALSAALEKTMTLATSLEAGVVATRSAAAFADAALLKSVAVDANLQAGLEKFLTVAATLSAGLAMARAVETSLDAVLSGVSAVLALGLDAALGNAPLVAAMMDAWLATGFTPADERSFDVAGHDTIRVVDGKRIVIVPSNPRRH